MFDTMYDHRYEYPRAKIIDRCMKCGCDIEEGEEYWDIEGQIMCYECNSSYKKIAGED